MSFKLPESIRLVLHTYTRRRRWVGFVTGLFLSLVIVFAVIGCGILADRLTLGLPASVRWAIFAGMSVAFLVVFFRKALWAAVQPQSRRKAAIGLGRRFPDAAEDLLTAVELSETPTEKSFSTGLVAAALQQISERAKQIDARLAVSLRPLAETGAICLVILGALFVAYRLAPEAVSNAISRLLRPGHDVPFFSYTQLTVRPGETVIRRGDSLKVSVELKGRIVKNATLELRSAETMTTNIPISGSSASWESGALFEDFSYRVKAGDAVAGWFDVRVLPAPVLRSKYATIISPEYAGSRKTELNPLPNSLTLVSGSAITFRFEPASRGADPRLRCSGTLLGPTGPMELVGGDDGVLSSPQILPLESGEFTVLLKDGFGLTNNSAASVSVRVLPDALPLVAIAEPKDSLLALPNARVRIAATATDDLGLRQLRLLMCHLSPSKDPAGKAAPWKEIVLAEGGQQAVSLEGAHEIVPAALGAVPGDRIEFKAASADFAGAPESRTSFSPVRTITIISEMEHLELVLRQLRALQADLMQLAGRQAMEVRQTESMLQTPANSNITSEAAQASERQTDLSRAGEDIFADLQKLLEELAANPTAPEEMLAELGRLADALKDVSQGPMSQAAQKLGQASQARTAQEATPSLKQARDQQEQAQRELQNLARLLERMQRKSILEKLADEADRLAALQLDLREATGRLATELGGATDASASGAPLPPALSRLVMGQENIHNGIVNLAQDMEKVKVDLSKQSPRQAASVERASAHLLENDTVAVAADIRRQLERNRPFSQLPRQEKVAATLKEVAKILREAAEADEMPRIIRELDEFIRRQKELNGGMEAILSGSEKAEKPHTLAENQNALQRDVREQSAAIEFAAKSLQLYKLKTPDLLNKAADFMDKAARELFASSVAKGLEYGRKALEMLEEARNTLQEEEEQMQQAEQEQQNEMPYEAIVLLMRTIAGQKRILSETLAADQIADKKSEQFNRLVTFLAGEQSALRKDVGQIMLMVPQMASLLNVAGEQMDASRRALQAGDTGENTRIIQRRVIAILESLLREQEQSGSGSGGGGGSSLQAMRRAMARSGGSSMGGNEGGENAPVDPARITRTDDEAWRRMRSKFEENLGAGFQSDYSSEFRGLINAYFESLRRGPEKK